MTDRELAMSNNPYAQQPPSPPNPYGAPPSNPYANPGAGGGYNPYAPPSALSEQGYGSPGYNPDESEMLAERGTRLGAQMLDSVLYMGAGAVGAMLGFVGGEMVAIGGAVTAVFALVIYQWILISTTGQTLSKKWLGIRIVRLDGSLPGFLHGVVLRVWVIQAVAAVVGIVGLVDALMIFGDERRCLHDHIAGTKVVVALSS